MGCACAQQQINYIYHLLFIKKHLSDSIEAGDCSQIAWWARMVENSLSQNEMKIGRHRCLWTRCASKIYGCYILDSERKGSEDRKRGRRVRVKRRDEQKRRPIRARAANALLIAECYAISISAVAIYKNSVIFQTLARHKVIVEHFLWYVFVIGYIRRAKWPAIKSINVHSLHGLPFL